MTTPAPTPGAGAATRGDGSPGEYLPVSVDGPVDRDAEFTAFAAQAAPALARTAWLLCGHTAQAEDLVQHALMRTYLAWPRARERDPLAYARKVLANARIDAWRKHRREVLTSPAELPESPGPGGASAGAAQAERDLLVRALATLTTRQRRIVVLRHLVGLTEAEVAADLSISVGTVKSTASRSLRTLRIALGELDPERADAGEPDRTGTTRGGRA